jgi:hypothetical protein
MAGPIQALKHAQSAWIKVEIAFPNNWNDTSLTWSDVTDRVRFTTDGGISWQRGRDDEFQEIVPGTVSITFNNLDRAFDPTYPGSPYFPYVDGGRPIRITCYYPTPATGFVQFIGQIDEWDIFWPPGRDAYVVATGPEMIGALANSHINANAFLSLTAQARLADLMAYAGIPVARQNFLNGTYAIQTQLYTNTDVLAAAQQVASSQNQVFYETRDGIFQTKGVFSGVGALATSFGEKTGTEIPFSTIDIANSGAYLYTVVEMTAAVAQGGAQAPVVTATVAGGGLQRYGYRPYARNIAALTQANAQSAATAMAALIAAKGLTRVKSVVIRPMRAAAISWPVVLAADFGNTCTFNYLPPGGGPRFSQDMIIRSIRHEIKRDWVVTWMTTPQHA